MKFFIVFACLLAIAVANEDAQVLRSESEVNVDSYKYALELDNSVKAEQQGELKGDALEVKGAFSYTSPEGEPIALTYTADENGYQPISDSLPTPPPVPEAILKAIAYIQAHPPAEEKVVV